MKLTTALILSVVAFLTACSSALKNAETPHSPQDQIVVFKESEVPILIARKKTQTVVFKESEVPTILAIKKNKKVSFKIIAAKPIVAEIPDAAE